MLRTGMSDHFSMFVESPPEIEFRDGLAHITYRIGETVFEYVMLPSVFAKALCSARATYCDYEAKRFPREVDIDDTDRTTH